MQISNPMFAAVKEKDKLTFLFIPRLNKDIVDFFWRHSYIVRWGTSPAVLVSGGEWRGTLSGATTHWQHGTQHNYWLYGHKCSRGHHEKFPHRKRSPVLHCQYRWHLHDWLDVCSHSAEWRRPRLTRPCASERASSRQREGGLHLCHGIYCLKAQR